MYRKALSLLLAAALALAAAQPALANAPPEETPPAGDTLGGAFTTPESFEATSLPEGLLLDGSGRSGISLFGISLFRLPSQAQADSVTLQLYINGALTQKTLSWRDALAGILNAEVGGFYGRYSDEAVLSAWTAQAVAIHTYLLYNNCETDNATSEVYKEADPNTPQGQLLYRAADQALDYLAVVKSAPAGSDTDPEAYDLALTTYYASAGMHPDTKARGTASSQDVWMAALPYLQEVASPYDEAVCGRLGIPWVRYPEYNFTRWEELTASLQKLYGVDVSPWQTSETPASALAVTRRTTYGYVPHDGLSVGGKSGLDGQKLYTGFRGTNWTAGLSSGCYYIEYIPGKMIAETGLGTVEEPWHLVAYGNGHGVGMSQVGALGYAEGGWSPWQILAHYYPGIRLYDRKNGSFFTLSEASASPIPLAEPEPTPLPREPGDILDDGGLTLADLLALAGHLAGTTPLTDPTQLALADANSDGAVNAADLQVLADALLG